MLGLALRYAPTPADAEDAVQDAFVQVFGRLDEQLVPGAFAGWVRRIVIRTALNAGRRHRVRRVDFDLDDARHVPTPEASAIEKLTFDEVQLLIDRLPDGCRLVLLLFTIEGYAHAEIAETLGITETNSKVLLTRARQRLTGLVQAAGRERTAPRPAPTPTAPTTLPGSAPAAPTAPFHPLTTLLFQ